MSTGPLKVLVSAYACEPGKGSEPGAGWEIVREVAQKHEVWLLTRNNNLDAICHEFDQNPQLASSLHVVGIDLPRWLRFWKRGRRGIHLYYMLWQRLAGQTAQLLHKQVGFDLVHHATLTNFWMPAGIASLDVPFVWGPVGGGTDTPAGLRRLLGAKGRLHDTLRKVVRRWGRTFAGSVELRAAASIAQNRETARWIERGSSSRVFICPNASLVKIEAMPQVEEPVPGLLLFVGNLLPLKGTALALEVLAALPNSSAELFVIGDGPDRKRLERLARHRDISGRLRFLGVLPRSSVFEWMRRAQVFLFPSLHDEASFAVAEALMLGVPVVCLDHGGPAAVARLWPGHLSSLIRPGTPPETVQRLTSAVETLLRSPPPRPAELVPPERSLAGVLKEAYEVAVGTLNAHSTGRSDS